MKYLTISNEIKDIPDKEEKNSLKLNIIEIGCSYSNKIEQVLKKEKLLIKKINNEYPNSVINFINTVILYNRFKNYPRKLGIDLYINMLELPNNFSDFVIFENLELKLKKQKLSENVFTHLKKIFKTSDKQKMDEILYSRNSENGIIKGFFMEEFFLNLLQKEQSEDMTIYKNNNIILNRNETEIDGIQSFYEKSNMNKLVNRLKEYSFLDIIYNPCFNKKYNIKHRTKGNKNFSLI